MTPCQEMVGLCSVYCLRCREFNQAIAKAQDKEEKREGEKGIQKLLEGTETKMEKNGNARAAVKREHIYIDQDKYDRFISV